MSFSEWMERLLAAESLSEAQAGGAIASIMTGELAPSQIAALLTAWRCKGESLDEVAGAAKAMRDCATPVETQREGLVDTCGTGGDRSGTFNISTVTAFIVAGAGVPVAKHGNRSATSKCGSFDLLEELGVNINLNAEGIARCINTVGIGALFARVVHPAMKHAGPIRAELGFRTIFNFLGPLTNPARPDFQLVGISDERFMELYAHCLMKMGLKRAWVVHGSDGLDELSLTGPSTVVEATPGGLKTFTISPGEAGFSTCSKDDLLGGDVKENAVLAKAILKNEDIGPKRDAAIFNAAGALVVAGRADGIAAGVTLARQSIESGEAWKRVEQLIDCSNA